MKEILKELFEKNCHFMQTGMQEDVMATIHPKSLSYVQTEAMLKQLFDVYQLQVDLKAFKYMGKDKTYAYARVQQQSKKIAGPEFKDNITDQLMIFKQDGEDWKIWTTAILNIKYTD